MFLKWVNIEIIILFFAAILSLVHFSADVIFEEHMSIRQAEEDRTYILIIKKIMIA